MIEELKNLQKEDTVFFTERRVSEFLEAEEAAVTGIKVYSNEDAEMVIVEMDEFYLIAHNFESEEKYFVYQLVDEGEIGELEEEGYKLLNEDDDFRYKIVVRDEGKSYSFNHSDTGAVYALNVDRSDCDSAQPQEVSVCEFKSQSARLENIMIERGDDHINIMQGFAIGIKDFTVPENL